MTNPSMFSTNIEVETPMMKQFKTIKSKYPDALLLFRCGDFYETYFDDAVEAAKILNITLTRRSNGGSGDVIINMAGFPFHALDNYLPKLVRAGKRVAICDQMEDPKLTKKLVKRDVTEVVTPAVSYSDATLPKQDCSFLACLYKNSDEIYGISFLDISTGEFLVGEGDKDEIDKLLVNFSPKEILVVKGTKDEFSSKFGPKYFLYELDSWLFNLTTAYERITKQFQTQSLKGFGVENLSNGIISAGVILYYLEITQHLQTNHIKRISRIERDRYVWLDRFTIRNLELITGTSENSHTLYEILNQTITPMGERLLRRWILFPLKEIRSIDNRLSVVKYFYDKAENLHMLSDELAKIQDLERIVSKISTSRITPREMLHLSVALDTLPIVKKYCVEQSESPYLATLGNQLNPLDDLRKRITQTINPTPPAIQGKPNTIQKGINTELDELRDILYNGKEYVKSLQQKEIDKTGIQSLRVGFNNVFGYYLEVRNTYKDKVPPSWIRKQTLVSAERYVTEELKEYEEKILNAEERILTLENAIFAELMSYSSKYISDLQINAAVIAQIDCLLSFTKVAYINHYVCPDVNDSYVIDIKDGRHPVIEKYLPLSEYYVPNDTFIDNSQQQIIILTGPNMAGKSALLRQTALIVLMAQIGSFVPATEAHIGLVDKIFTRVGAGDNISAGESTFMSEMTEAAGILNNLSDRSLVLFDELGRGTSTYDGISLAWAIVEYLHEDPDRPRVFFATHYHELNDLETRFARVHNYNISVQENEGKVIFLRKMIPGGAEHSFGINVARLAGIPSSITHRASEILQLLEQERINIKEISSQAAVDNTYRENPNYTKVNDILKEVNINSITPLEALNMLAKIKAVCEQATDKDSFVNIK